MIRVAIVDDSRFVRQALTRLLLSEPDIAIAGVAETGEELLRELDRWRPDVITLDLAMPGIGGLATLDCVVARHPTPVVILSTHSGDGAPLTLEALSRGAADFVDKEAHSLVDFQALRAVLLGKIRALGRRCAGRAETGGTPIGARSGVGAAAAGLVAIGASTGGPGAIEQIIGSFRPFPAAPVVVVQHMPPGFTAAFAERLARQSPFPVFEAAHGVRLAPGNICIAPAGLHLRVERRQGGVWTMLDAQPASAAHRPSVDVLFHSVASAAGGRALAVLLTGMGRDGAEGMAAVAAAGGHTIAQAGATCVVDGMPRAAVELGAAREVLPLGEIGPRLGQLMHQPTLAA